MAGGAPPISVVMTVYQGERHVGEAVESILGQTLTTFEFVVVDDGSTDGTREILARFEDSRLRVLSPGRLGRAGALNLALTQVRAPLVAFMDADDVSLPERLRLQVAHLESHRSVGVCGTWFVVTDEAGCDLYTMPTVTRDEDIRRRLLVGNPLGGPTAVVRRELLDQVGGFRQEYVPSEDHDLWRRLLPLTSFVNLPSVLYRYRNTTGGLSDRFDSRQIQLTRQIVEDVRRTRFPVYTVREVLAGERFYRLFPTPFRQQLLADYGRDQAIVSTLLFRQGRVLAGMRNLVGALLVRPTAFRVFGIPWRGARRLARL